jgi:hypothetical protein
MTPVSHGEFEHSGDRHYVVRDFGLNAMSGDCSPTGTGDCIRLR